MELSVWTWGRDPVVYVYITIMTCLREFSCSDLFKFNKVNFDPLTETYALSFYMSYMARWPDYFKKIENFTQEVVGYSKLNFLQKSFPLQELH